MTNGLLASLVGQVPTTCMMASLVIWCRNESWSMGWLTSSAFCRNSSGSCHTPYLKVVLDRLVGPSSGTHCSSKCCCSVLGSPCCGGAARSLWAGFVETASRCKNSLYSGTSGWCLILCWPKPSRKRSLSLLEGEGLTPWRAAASRTQAAMRLHKIPGYSASAAVGNITPWSLL